ncbi:beta-ketoacyl-ACP synthase III [Ereboglobus luteus]|uniref:beta-ketoacyl-ACP synthase III n=1 Tax=Ereboglobus luteus TaxID=1796921 RepID=UPI001864129C|nr:beta-ketoacyl-ACP synthase III [Ereboglobus luteus]
MPDANASTAASANQTPLEAAIARGAIAILGTGSCAPANIITNNELARRGLNTTDEWIRTRTGISSRHVASEGEATSDFATVAGRRALTDAGLTPADIDLVIVATLTPDLRMPACATLVMQKLGIKNGTPGFDLNAACTGFLYALDTAWAMISSGRYKHALIIGAETISSILDWKDRNTCVLFGDGAGAAVLGKTRARRATFAGLHFSPKRAHTLPPEILGVRLYCTPDTELLRIPVGGSLRPLTPENHAERQHYIQMHGKEVFKIAVREMERAAREILEQHNLGTDQISLVIPHQANHRIIDAIARNLNYTRDRVYVNLDRYGNTSAASIPIALDEARRSGRIHPGDLTLFLAFGAGLTYGSALVRW